MASNAPSVTAAAAEHRPVTGCSRPPRPSPALERHQAGRSTAPSAEGLSNIGRLPGLNCMSGRPMRAGNRLSALLADLDEPLRRAQDVRTGAPRNAAQWRVSNWRALAGRFTAWCGPVQRRAMSARQRSRRSMSCCRGMRSTGRVARAALAFRPGALCSNGCKFVSGVHPPAGRGGLPVPLAKPFLANGLGRQLPEARGCRRKAASIFA